MKQLSLSPTAKIAIKKNVLKVYTLGSEDAVFLPKDVEFEIELFNPLMETVLAKIELNGKSISSTGIILKPGQRVFLERFLEDNKKFKFETYQVENSPEAKAAIKNNGLVQVSFFKQKEYYTIDNSWWYTNPYPANLVVNSPQVFCGATTLTAGNPNYSVIGSTGSYVDTSRGIITASATPTVYCSTIDTGIIAKGSESDQSFVEVDMDFNLLAFKRYEVKLYPDTQKPVSSEDITKTRKYCSECGSKLKATDKFCSECGTKLN